MILYRVTVDRLFLTSLLLLVIYNEYIVYVWKSFTTWPEITCPENEICTKVLVIADPQILGDLSEYIFARFDNDRYLRNTFLLAFDHVKPDCVVFLGDLFDEGSKATDEQFARYYSRFQSIFQLEKIRRFNIPVVIIPGDNDISDEMDQMIKAANVKRFRKYFGKEEAVVVRNVRFFKVNKLLRTYPVAEDELLNEKFIYNIVVSHIPLTVYPSLFTDQVVRDIKPEFIFSAHDHKSYALLTLRENGKQLYYEDLKQNAFRNGISSWTFQAAYSTNYTVITEIVVPTCSYRMGVADMAYGVIVFSKKYSEITYHVLWLPSRFACLSYYVIFFLFCIMILWIFSSRFRRAYIVRNTSLC